MASVFSIFIVGAYILLARLVLRHGTGTAREIIFAVLNLAGFHYCFFSGLPFHASMALGIYLALVLLQYALLRWFSENSPGSTWLAFFTPLLFLILIRYVPNDRVVAAFAPQAHGLIRACNAVFFVGLSFQAFRCSRLVLEIRNGQVMRPGVWEYLNFAFFLPTMSVGPINTYANFRRGFGGAREAIPAGRSALRMLVGFVKYQLFASFFGQLGYANLLTTDNHLHPWVDLPVAMVSYYLFLYCNFSGYCDMVIGAAGLIGISVPENFENPLAARNLREFWNRWHITLSAWMRDVVFSPLSKLLVRSFGPAHANHAIALTIVVVFLLIGIWHGAGWNFVALGATQSLGVVGTHYYTIFLKQRLGRAGFKAYNENRLIRALAVTVTFCYVAASLIFLANTFAEVGRIFSVLR